MSSPSKRIFPPVGGNAPATMLKIVVLPAPFGPIMPVIRLASMWNEHRSTAVRPPKRRVNSSTTRMGGFRDPEDCAMAVTGPILAANSHPFPAATRDPLWRPRR